MAFILDRPEGKWIRFAGLAGNRQTIKLGKATSKTAAEVCRRVELLLEARAANTACDRETAAWAVGLSDKLRARLAHLGLIDKPADESPAVTLDAFTTAYIANLNVKSGTRFNLDLARRNLVEFFGANKPLPAITIGDADDFRRWLERQFADNTVAIRCRRAREFFKAAKKKRLIDENPFAEMKDCRVKGNRSRDYFLSLADATKVIEACPNAQWKLLFALCRFGGLRCPSEVTLLKWSDIDWTNNRFTVHSPKTEHHEGKESRVVPLFPELRPYLESAREQAKRGAEFVITIRSVERSRQTGKPANLGTRMAKIVARAGLTVWPKLFQNLRQTRQTELAQSFPEHVVCQWIGNSQAVAREHYLRVTEDDFAKAAKESAPKAEPSRNLFRNLNAAAQSGTLGNAIQQVLEAKGVGEIYPVIRELLENARMTPTGLEPVLPP